MAIGNKRRSSQSLSKRPLDLPAATVHAFAGTSAPEGWAMCDGSEINKTQYAALYSVIGDIYGTPVDSNNFVLPDLRGEFLRGLDDMGTAKGARGKDVDGTARTVGQTQGDAIRNITGQMSPVAHSKNIGMTASGALARTGIDQGNALGTGSGNTVTFDASRQVPTGAENRPVNIAVNYIIKL